jgi:hypothetical protein
MSGSLHKQRHKDKTIQCICKICTTTWVLNLAGCMCNPQKASVLCKQMLAKYYADLVARFISNENL